MFDIALLLVLCALFALWIYGFFRAAGFALRRQDHLEGVIEHSSWWLRLLKKNAFGPEVDGERVKAALHFYGPLVVFFILATFMFLRAPAA